MYAASKISSRPTLILAELVPLRCLTLKLRNHDHPSSEFTAVLTGLNVRDATFVTQTLQLHSYSTTGSFDSAIVPGVV